MSASSLRLARKLVTIMLSTRALQYVFIHSNFATAWLLLIRPRKERRWQCHIRVLLKLKMRPCQNLLTLKRIARAKKQSTRRTQSAITTAHWHNLWHINFITATLYIWILTTLMASRSKMRGITLRRLLVCLPRLFFSIATSVLMKSVWPTHSGNSSPSSSGSSASSVSSFPAHKHRT